MIKTLCLDAISAIYNVINPIVEQKPVETPYLMTIELTHPLTSESLIITGTPCYENKEALEILEILTPPSQYALCNSPLACSASRLQSSH